LKFCFGFGDGKGISASDRIAITHPPTSLPQIIYEVLKNYRKWKPKYET
jgi:hypothetical protein